jgi:hypothetical protein
MVKYEWKHAEIVFSTDSGSFDTTVGAARPFIGAG